jgi:hypothetical protein
VTRRQAIDVGSDGRRALLVEHFLVVAEFVEAPQVAVVVAIADLGIGEMDIGQLVALAAGTGDVGQSQLGDCFAAGLALGHRLVEVAHELQQLGVLIAMFGIEQRAREHAQAMTQAGGGLGIAGAGARRRVQGQEDAAHARVGTHDQHLDAAVFENLDRQALHRAAVVGEHRRTPAAMAGNVRQGGAVAVDAGNALRVVKDIGQADAGGVVIRQRSLLLVGIGRIRYESRAVAPQPAQVEVEQALLVDQQRAVALALQHGAAVRRLEAEVVALPLGMIRVVADAVIDPVAQPGDRQLLEQGRGLRKEIGQAGAGESLMNAVDRTGGALGELLRQVQVALQLLARRQTPGDGGQGLQEGSDRLGIR